MSGSVAKEARRDLRRTVGAHGLAALGQLDLDVQELRSWHRTLQGQQALALGPLDPVYLQTPLVPRVRTLERLLEQLARARQMALEREQARNRSVWTRLRWLLTGR